MNNTQTKQNTNYTTLFSRMRGMMLMLTIILLSAVSSFAQTTVIIGANSGANTTTTYPCPLQDWYKAQRAQYLYKAADLAAAGVTAGSTITGIGWVANATAVSGFLQEGYSIALKNTSLAALTLTTWETGFTSVYGPTNYSYVSGTSGNIIFPTSSFTYTGGDLIVEVCGGATAGGFTSNVQCQWTTAVGYNASHTFRSDAPVSGFGCGNATTTNTGTATTRPRLVINYTSGGACAGTPTPGNTLTTAASVCPSTSFTLSLQNNTPGTGVSYQWESSPVGLNTWTPIGGATSSSYTGTQAAATDYHCVVTCTGNPSGTSNTVTINMESACACAVYCASNATQTADTKIDSVYINGTMVGGSAATNCETYTYRSTSVSLQAAVTYPFFVRNGSCSGVHYAAQLKVYADWNQDLDFLDSGEEIYVTPSNTTALNSLAPFNITIPPTANLGQTRFRFVFSEVSVPGPCGTYAYGETEDYCVNILAPVYPADPPNGSISGTPDCISGATLVATGTAPVGETWYWQTSPTGTSQVDDAAFPYVTFNAGTYYIRSRDNTTGLWSLGAGSVSFTLPAGPTVSSLSSPANPACGSVVLNATGAMLGLEEYYWQGTNPLGTSTALLADDGTTQNPYNATASGTYYVRGRDALNGCWGPDASIVVTVNPIPGVTTFANPTVICLGASSQLIAAATGGTGNPPPGGYCFPTMFPSNPCNYLSNVTTTGGITNFTNTTASYNGTGATYFPGSTCSQALGSTINVTCTAAGTCNIAYYFIWVDWDQSGSFSPSEMVVNGTGINSGNTPTTFPITIPVTATPGNTRMRIMARGLGSPAPTTACDNESGYYGETEDYVVGITGAGITYSWTPAGDMNNASIFNPLATPTTVGINTYTVNIVDANGCTNSSTVDVDALAIPPAPLASSVSQCGLGSQTLTATGTGGTLNWYDAASGGTLLASGGSYTTPVLGTTTSYWVEEYNGVCSSFRTQVTVTVTPPDAITISTTNPAFCQGGSTTMTASSLNASYVYTWSPAPGSTSGSFNENATDAPMSTTTYTVTGTDGICTETATIVITVNPYPTIISISATPSIICPGGSSQLNVSSSALLNLYTYDFTGGFSGWTTGNEALTVFGQSSIASTWAAQAFGNGANSLGTTNQGDFGAEHSWILSPLLTFNAGTLSISFDAFTNNETGSYDNETVEYSTDNGATWVDITGTLTPGTIDNNVSWTNYTATATIVSATSNGRLRFRYDTGDGCCGGTGTNNGFYVDNVSISTPGGGGTIAWTAPTNLNNASIADPIATPPSTETYTVTVTDPIGCSTNATVTVTVSPVPGAPVGTGATQCGLGSSTISAVGSGGSLNWYDAPVAGTLLTTGSSYTTPVMNVSSSYWVAEYNGACEGPRTQVDVIVTAADPISVVSSDPFICTNVAPFTTILTASSVNLNYSYSWNPAPLSTSGTFNENATVNPSATTTYTVTGTDGICTETQTIVVTVGTAPVLTATATPSTIPCGGTSQLEVTSTVGCTNYLVNPITLAPTAPAGPTNPGPAGDDIVTGAIPIGFPFNFYGTTYTDIYISTNGFISFLAGQGSGCCSGQLIPDAFAPNAVVAIDWMDLNTNNGGNIDYYNLTSPNRMVIRYNSVATYSATGVCDGQIILYDNGKIEIHNNSITTTGGLQTQGIENELGTIAHPVPGRNSSAWNASDAYEFVLSCPAANITWTPGATLSNPLIYNPIATPAGTTTYTVSASDAVGCVGTSVTTVTLPSCNAVLTVSAFIQGYYRSATDDMVPVLNNQGEPNGLTDCDTVTVELRDATFPYAVAYSTTGVIGTNGNVVCSFPGAAVGNSYWIAVRNRTAVETWSAAPVLAANTYSYDFRGSDAQAYGNNMIQVNTSPVRWAFFSGDIDQSGGIDGDDFNLLDPDIQSGNGGYLSTDLDGSGGVDGDDFNIFDPNSQAGVGAFLP
ncbi:MAG: choice-of-anchor J domain-containing protein [Chitinophagaceae bacterium]|nr:choice-of-anchor J domain-containing protein [Chitinophagaceae bacterium]